MGININDLGDPYPLHLMSRACINFHILNKNQRKLTLVHEHSSFPLWFSLRSPSCFRPVRQKVWGYSWKCWNSSTSTSDGLIYRKHGLLQRRERGCVFKSIAIKAAHLLVTWKTESSPFREIVGVICGLYWWVMGLRSVKGIL